MSTPFEFEAWDSDVELGGDMREFDGGEAEQLGSTGNGVAGAGGDAGTVAVIAPVMVGAAHGVANDITDG